MVKDFYKKAIFGLFLFATLISCGGAIIFGSEEDKIRATSNVSITEDGYEKYWDCNNLPITIFVSENLSTDRMKAVFAAAGRWNDTVDELGKFRPIFRIRPVPKKELDNWPKLGTVVLKFEPLRKDAGFKTIKSQQVFVQLNDSLTPVSLHDNEKRGKIHSGVILIDDSVKDEKTATLFATHGLGHTLGLNSEYGNKQSIMTHNKLGSLVGPYEIEKQDAERVLKMQQCLVHENKVL